MTDDCDAVFVALSAWIAAGPVGKSGWDDFSEVAGLIKRVDDSDSDATLFFEFCWASGKSLPKLPRGIPKRSAEACPQSGNSNSRTTEILANRKAGVMTISNSK